MSKFNRRDFLKVAGATTAIGAMGAPMIGNAASGKGRVIVIGGGYAGAISAKYIKLTDPNIKVTLIEKNSRYVSCPLSNEVLGGERTVDSLTFDYRGLSARGIQVMQDEVVEIDAAAKYVKGKSGNRYNYDRLVVAPGVELRRDAIAGYDSDRAMALMPHAWKAGAQTTLLRKQLESMRDGGTFYILAPPNPFRCPPGPYERAAQVAHYFKQHKPKSKVIILDAKDKFSKAKLFRQGWAAHYGDMIEWVAGSDGGITEEVVPGKGMIIGQVEERKGDVVNVIPAQRAGRIAQMAGLTNKKGWCPVDQKTFESSIHKDVYVIGDSSVAGKMPKSGYAANSQGKVCAAAVVASINGGSVGEPSYVNTCYSIITPKHGISVAKVYKLKDGKIVGIKGSGGLSPISASSRTRADEVQYAYGWYRNITGDMFG